MVIRNLMFMLAKINLTQMRNFGARFWMLDFDQDKRI